MQSSKQMEVDHPFHPEHKLVHKTVEILKKSYNGVVCAACRDEISSQHYHSCRDCQFFLHKLCAQRPSELTHSSHPHPLQLLQKSPYEGNAPSCLCCYEIIEGFIYHCAICNFDLCFICAFPDGPEPRHYFHRKHKLTYEKIVKRADKGVVCELCDEEISGPLSNFYSCRECKFFLHELCFQRPHELTSSLHPQHPLTLTHRMSLLLSDFCNGCHQKGIKNFVYLCEICRFCLHFTCAFPDPENRVQSFGNNVHPHPLRLITTPSKFSCSLCSPEGDDDEDQSYICSIPTCDFWVHKMCAFTTLTQRYEGHHHPLSLNQGVPEDLQIYDDIYCCVCRKTIYPTDWVSHCARCTLFVHIMCMTNGDADLLNSIKDDVDYFDDSFIKLLLNGDEFVDWPLADISSELIQPFLLEKNNIINMDVQLKIRHLSHMQHDMILFQELHVNNDSFFEEEDEEVMCDGCIYPITAPYYCCDECKYYLHLACANLPPKIKHFSHPQHDLFMGYQDKFWENVHCDCCTKRTNGFFYFCKPCYIHLDLRCAALPAMIMHKTHQHPLRQIITDYDEGACYACGKFGEYGKILKCTYCNMFVHFDCAMRSLSIRHRWDRQHPIDIKFPPHDRPRGHIMCDMCEELIHPLYWLYSCFECEVSFHMDCVPRYASYNNIKDGGKVDISSHPHALKYLNKPTLKIACDKCERKFYGEAVFECETCYYCICRSCMMKNELS